MIADFETNLERVLAQATSGNSPARLGEAMHYAVFPGGARVRPLVCLAVASAHKQQHEPLAQSCAMAIELMHCASLVHDDMPCFDNADLRRSKPSVHKSFGQPLALLVGDALIVLAFQTLAESTTVKLEQQRRALAILSRSVGAPSGIIAGQAWECEEEIDLSTYHRSKTGSLFVAASMLGALSAGQDPEDWRVFGASLGEAYQVADDLRDVTLSEEESGKSPSKDAELGRPNAVTAMGVSATRDRFEHLLQATTASIPQCDGADHLKALVLSESERLMSKCQAD